MPLVSNGVKINGWIYSFLRKTQKYTGTDNVYLAQGGSWLALAQVVSLLASFLLGVAFANLLDPITYGNYQYILSLIGMLGIFSLQGMRTAVIQAVSRGFEGSFFAGFKTRLKWGSLGSLLAMGGAVYYWFKGNEILPFPLLISAVFLPLMNASKLYSSFMAGRKLFSTGVKYNIASTLIYVTAITTTLLLTKNLLWLIAVYLVVHTFSNCLFDILTITKFKPNKKEDPQTLNYAKHLSLTGVVSLMGDYLDKILLFAFIGPAQLAIYSFAIIIPDQITGIMGNVSILALPKLASKTKEDIKANIMKKFWRLFFLSIIIIALYIIIAPYFYKIFFPQYLGSIPYSQVFALSFLALPASLLDTVFRAKMAIRNIYLLRIASFFRIALFIILIPLYGIWGLIMAKLGTIIFNSGLTLFLFKRF